jgi:hypothetical protein
MYGEQWDFPNNERTMKDPNHWVVTACKVYKEAIDQITGKTFLFHFLHWAANVFIYLQQYALCIKKV